MHLRWFWPWKWMSFDLLHIHFIIRILSTFSCFPSFCLCTFFQKKYLLSMRANFLPSGVWRLAWPPNCLCPFPSLLPLTLGILVNSDLLTFFLLNMFHIFLLNANLWSPPPPPFYHSFLLLYCSSFSLLGMYFKNYYWKQNLDILGFLYNCLTLYLLIKPYNYVR